MRTKQFKYIIVSNGDAEVAILFNPFLVHSFIKVEKFKIVSAGFCKLISYYNKELQGDSLAIEANGESISLKLKSRSIDKDIIYKTCIAGPWDYGINSEDPLYNELAVSIEKKVMNETE